MKPTKKQRHEAYKYAHDVISNLKEDDERFICWVINEYFNYTISVHLETGLMPELNLFKPNDFFAAWFVGKTGYDLPYSSLEVKEAQKIILEFCIEMTKPETNG